MREILFRGKTADGKWIDGFLFQEVGDCVVRWCITRTPLCANDYSEIMGDYAEVIPETVGQYTGLTDKNGTKIFEGDVLSVTVREFVRECGVRKLTGKTIKTVWYVEYAERRSQGNGFYVFGKDRRFSLGLTKSVIYNASPEVIGNIHDNPELLKGGEG